MTSYAVIPPSANASAIQPTWLASSRVLSPETLVAWLSTSFSPLRLAMAQLSAEIRVA
jgi:hypothetical protein